jgi:hypothetical protein
MIEATIRGVKITPEIVRRFWGKVDVRSPDECWPWVACLAGSGYGAMGVRENAMCRQKMAYAHRMAYTLVYGTIPKTENRHDTVVRHSCDNKLCCNPFHLDLGSAKDNADDRGERGRTARGESQGSAKLSEAQVLKIREIHAKGETSQACLAKRYGVKHAAIHNIVTRKKWKHI